MDKLLAIDINRDLEWLRDAPSLMSHSHSPTFDTLHTKPNLANQPALTHYPILESFRLGRLFEDCVALAIDQSASHSLIARNIQISEDKKTIGELDYLYTVQDTEHIAEIIHLETAIKFYLFSGKHSGLSQFIGPNGNDRLDKKWAKLIHHQLPLGTGESTRTFLTNHNLPTPTRSELLLTGYLFYPYGSDYEAIIEADNELKSHLNPKHYHGWWLSKKSLEPLVKDALCHQWRFIILPKYFWIGGTRHFSKTELMGKSMEIDELIHTANITNGPLQVAVLNYEQKNLKEISRGFIVGSEWPEKK